MLPPAVLTSFLRASLPTEHEEAQTSSAETPGMAFAYGTGEKKNHILLNVTPKSGPWKCVSVL